MGMPDTEQGKISILLDLDHVSQVTRKPDVNELTAHLDAAHDRIENVFESCLTDDLRQRLNREA